MKKHILMVYLGYFMTLLIAMPITLWLAEGKHHSVMDTMMLIAINALLLDIAISLNGVYE